MLFDKIMLLILDKRLLGVNIFLLTLVCQFQNSFLAIFKLFLNTVKLLNIILELENKIFQLFLNTLFISNPTTH